MNNEQTRKHSSFYGNLSLKNAVAIHELERKSQIFYVNFLASKSCMKRRQLHVKLLHRFFAFVVMKSRNWFRILSSDIAIVKRRLVKLKFHKSNNLHLNFLCRLITTCLSSSLDNEGLCSPFAIVKFLSSVN